MEGYEIVLDNSVMELVVQADSEIVITGEDSFDVLLEGDVEVLVDNDTIELLSLYEGTPGQDGQPGPEGQRGNTITIDEAPPAAPIPGDIWLPKGIGIIVDGGGSGEPVPGPQGPAGKDGVDGTNGRDGVDGIDGLPGRDGADGVDGTNGIDGLPGVQGEPGRDGIDGAPGIDGTNGLPGTNGTNGTNGTGVPTGGVVGQKLQKATSADFDTAWVFVSRPMVAGTATGMGTATISWGANEVIRLTLQNNSVTLTMLGAQDGQVCRLEVIQDAVGGRNLILGPQVGFSSDMPSYTTMTAANKRDYLEFIYNAATAKYYLIRVVKGL